LNETSRFQESPARFYDNQRSHPATTEAGGSGRSLARRCSRCDVVAIVRSWVRATTTYQPARWEDRTRPQEREKEEKPAGETSPPRQDPPTAGPTPEAEASDGQATAARLRDGDGLLHCTHTDPQWRRTMTLTLSAPPWAVRLNRHTAPGEPAAPAFCPRIRGLLEKRIVPRP